MTEKENKKVSFKENVDIKPYICRLSEFINQYSTELSDILIYYYENDKQIAIYKKENYKSISHLKITPALSTNVEKNKRIAFIKQHLQQIFYFKQTIDTCNELMGKIDESLEFGDFEDETVLMNQFNKLKDLKKKNEVKLEEFHKIVLQHRTHLLSHVNCESKNFFYIIISNPKKIPKDKNPIGNSPTQVSKIDFVESIMCIVDSQTRPHKKLKANTKQNA